MKKAVSLISLSVTIIVITIIATVVVLTISKDDTINRAEKVVEDANYKNLLKSVNNIYTNLETSIALGRSPLTEGQTVSNYIYTKLVNEGVSQDELDRYIITDNPFLITKVYPKKGTESFWTYTINTDDTLTITSYTGTGSDLSNVVIPNVIKVGGIDKRVTALKGVVVNISNITPVALFVENLTISDGITEITDGALANSRLASRNITGYLTLPKTLEIIGDYALYNLRYSNSEIVLPENLEYIGVRGCSFIRYGVDNTRLVMNKRLKEIGVEAFMGSDIEGELVFPNSVKKISDNAFYNCYNITKVIFNEGIEYLSGFMSCRSLACDIIIPSSVRTIGQYAFHGCYLEGYKLYIKEGVTKIMRSAFYSNCFSGDIIIPSSVRTIEELAFCNALMDDEYGNVVKLVIKEGVQTIGNSAFNGCVVSNSITIPSTVQIMGNSVFYGAVIEGEIFVNKTEAQCSSWPADWYNNYNNVIPTYKQ